MNPERSYKAHQNNLKETAKSERWRFYYLKNKSSFHYQKVIYPFKYLSPFFKHSHNWLTIGDYNGLEANYLLTKNQRVVAGDIATDMLEIAHELGAITEYKAVNVEKMPYEDNSFDYIYCKESFHHFPRAYLGAYEMIRCAKKAVIITETLDPLMHYVPLLLLKVILDNIAPNLYNKNMEESHFLRACREFRF